MCRYTKHHLQFGAHSRRMSAWDAPIHTSSRQKRWREGSRQERGSERAEFGIVWQRLCTGCCTVKPERSKNRTSISMGAGVDTIQTEPREGIRLSIPVRVNRTLTRSCYAPQICGRLWRPHSRIQRSWFPTKQLFFVKSCISQFYAY